MTEKREPKHYFLLAEGAQEKPLSPEDAKKIQEEIEKRLNALNQKSA